MTKRLKLLGPPKAHSCLSAKIEGINTMDNQQGNLFQAMQLGVKTMSYSIGAMFGDGTIGVYSLASGHIMHTVSIRCMDYECIKRVTDEVNRFFNETHKVYTYTNPNGTLMYGVSFHSVHTHAIFHFFVREKLFIPDEIFRADRDSQLDFVAGLFDTDGYVSAGVRYRIGFASRHRTFVEDLVRLLSKLGVNVGTIYSQISQYGTTMYVIKPNIKSFIMAGCYFYIPRKFNKLKGYGSIVEEFTGNKTFRDYNVESITMD